MAGNSEITARKNGMGRPFEKGKSGNPNGRPKVDPAVKEMLKAASKDAAQLLIDAMTSPAYPPTLRIDAAKEILNRVYGKPAQTIQGDMSIDVGRGKLDAILEQIKK